MKQMIKNWREIESLGNFLYRDTNGNVRITEAFFDLNGNNPLVVQNLKDGAGNKRFIEGNIETEDITGVTFSYSKWSLSGSHLMIVICGDILENVTVSSNEKVCDISFPNYIKDKLMPIYSAWLGSKNAECIEEVTFSHNVFLNVDMDKTANGVVINTGAAITASENKRHFRLTFDLLIDMAD